MAWFGIGWDDVFARGEEQRGKELDEQLADLNRRKLDSGSWTTEQYQAAEDNRLRNRAETYGEQIGGEFIAGAKEGLASAQDAVKSTLSGGARGALGFIPWWLWLVGAVWLAFQLGLFKKLR